MPVDFMNTLSEDSRKANETYLTIMKQYIANNDIKENENVKIKVASPENAAELLEIYKFYV